MCCEYQEVIYVLVNDENNLNILKSICTKKMFLIVGYIRNDSILKVFDNRNTFITNVVNYDTNIQHSNKSFNLISILLIQNLFKN